MLGGAFAHAQHFLQHLHDIVFEVGIAFARFEPRFTVYAFKRFTELLGFALLVDKLLQLGKFQVFAEEAQVFVEYALERTQQRGFGGVARFPLAALAVDVEQDGFGGHLGAAAHFAVHQIVLQLAVEIVDGALARHFVVCQQVGKHLQEVRFTRAEEAGNPHAYFVGRHVERFLVVFEKRGEMTLQFARYHVFGKLLLDGGFVVLGDFDYAVDGTVDVFCEQVFDNHCCSSERSNAR